MSNHKILAFIALVLFYCSLNSQEQSPNIILITLDDMNWDSPGIYGSKIPNITPNIDSLANQGIRFERAYVQAPNCSPSRVVIQTGLYPHQNGNRGFFYAQPNGNSLPEVLKENGYFTGVLNKPADTSPSPDFERFWDVSKSITDGGKRSKKSYSKLLTSFLSAAQKENKPFYCVLNIADPHKPFFNDPIAKKKGFDEFEPSQIYELKDVEVPPFLPKHPKIKQEVLNYYNSVKRGDDCVGAVLNSIYTSVFSENTIVILLSDHGAAFPFAKSSIYQNGVKTPLIVSWPKKIKKKSVNTKSMVSSIDISATILDLAQISIPKVYEGKSFYPQLLGDDSVTQEYVYAQFDENAGGIPRPSRTVISKKFGYVFNPWATGKFKFISASTYHLTYKTMRKLAEKNNEVSKRFNNWIYRTVEELYDYEKDPHALNNLINDPEYKEIANQLRSQLEAQMHKTNDYLLLAFENKDNKNYLNDWMGSEIEKAELRRKTLKWKRGNNASGNVKKNKLLFQVNLN